MNSLPSQQVNEQRLWQRHQIMAGFGATSKGGVNRQALSREDVQARKQLVDWGAALGLLASHDPAGNLFLKLQGVDPDETPLLCGSHLDSQPTGGKFDGVYGVLAALEAVQAIVKVGRPRRSIEVVAWMNEEGSRFAPGMMGSAVFTGARSLGDILDVQDELGITVRQALNDVFEQTSDIPKLPLGRKVRAYIEAHIEQGPVLERGHATVGIVTGIQGKCTFRVRVIGEAAHAGTAERAERRDALAASVAIIAALTECIYDKHDAVKFTIGRLLVTPNAPSVVPGEVNFWIDLRHPDSGTLRRLADSIEPVCRERAGPCVVEVTEISRAMPSTFPPEICACIRAAASRLGVSFRDIYSAAGHDAYYLNRICPTAMLFVPCHLGITHNEAESATPSDLAAGAKVLADVLAELAE
jgi:N-carbamoyl-L-amino-acid hydrolase